MSEQPRGDAIFEEWFKQVADGLADGKLAPSLLSPEMVGPMLEIQRTMMHRLLDVFVDPSSGEAAEARKKEMTKAAMLCSLELIKATREYREQVVGAQSKLLERYIESLAETESPQAAPGAAAENEGGDADPATPRG